ncbi:MAG TPA: S41 family peptidase [Candidatus Magasanikbacteria bacterium]|nr:S41 family peptidase [Candidatus Magasanikbacteria bacterium]HQF57214.1 S41 family peptidase [Candidatus Magasanikbacteria bacterium]
MKSRKYILFGLVMILVLLSGIILGRFLTLRSALLNENGQVSISKVLDLYGKTKSEKVSFEQFWEVWNIIKEKYVDQPVNEVDLFYGAMGGMVAGLGDQNSFYFSPEKAKEFANDLSGEFEGIGAEIGIREGQLIVIAPLPNSPAELAGLRKGDKIFKINDEEIFGITLDEAVNKIRGKKGTTVKLNIRHFDSDVLEDIIVKRDIIVLSTVEWKMMDNAIAYLSINYFNQDTWSNFDKAVKDIIAKKPQGLILDLRSNPGGYLETAVDIASEWVKKGLIVLEKFSDGTENKYETRGSHRLSEIKTVVLIDGGSASGSEIVAGALQDYKLATLIGEVSYGKGSVQDFQVLADGSALKLTVARWFTPLNRQIDKKGIEPDIVLENMYEDISIDEKNGEINYTDLGIQKALEILQ